MPRQAYKRTSRGKNARRKSEFILCGEIRQDFFLFFSWLLCYTENKLLLIHFFVSDFFSIPAGIDKNARSKWFCPVRRTSVRRGAKTLAEKVNLFFAEKSVRISSYFSWLLCYTENKLLLIHFFVPDFFSIPDYTYQRSKYALQIFFISSHTTACLAAVVKCARLAFSPVRQRSPR